MYEEFEKEGYLEYLRMDHRTPAYIKEVERMFNKTESFEEKQNCDIAYFSEDELLEVYDAICPSLRQKLSYNMKLKLYARLLDIDASKFDRLSCKLRGKVYSKDVQEEEEYEIFEAIYIRQLHQMLETLENPSDQFILYGLFSGIKGKDYVELTYSTMEDSDEKAHTIWLAGYDEEGNIIKKARLFYAPPDLFEIAKRSSQEQFIYWVDKNGVRRKNPSSEDGLIAKHIDRGKTDPAPTSRRERTKARISILLSRFKGYEHMKPSDVYWSGFCCALRQVMLYYGKDISVPPNANDVLTLPMYEQVLLQYNLKGNIDIRSLEFRLKKHYKMRDIKWWGEKKKRKKRKL